MSTKALGIISHRAGFHVIKKSSWLNKGYSNWEFEWICRWLKVWKQVCVTFDSFVQALLRLVDYRCKPGWMLFINNIKREREKQYTICFHLQRSLYCSIYLCSNAYSQVRRKTKKKNCEKHKEKKRINFLGIISVLHI